MNRVMFTDSRVLYLLIINVWSSSSFNITEIRIGILLAQTISPSLSVNGWESGDFYASAFQIAVEEINNNTHLLPGFKLEYFYNDTKCLEEGAVKSFHHQIFEKNAIGVIGLGCSKCDCLAKYASFANIMMISHVSVTALT